MMSSLHKMLSILDLFSEEKPTWTTEEMANELDFSIPTGYRYVRELNNSGLIARVKGGSYIIGPKIIKLDRQVRLTDPMIAVGKPIMKNLVDITGCEVLLSNIYNEEILVIHMEKSNDKSSNFTRGKPHPIYKGSTSKVILANLPKNQMQKLFLRYQDEKIDNFSNSFEEFKSSLSKIRRQGYCITHEEIEIGLSAIAAPVFENHQIKGSLCLVIPTARFTYFNLEKMIEILQDSANRITSLISESLDQHIE